MFNFDVSFSYASGPIGNTFTDLKLADFRPGFLPLDQTARVEGKEIQFCMSSGTKKCSVQFHWGGGMQCTVLPGRRNCSVTLLFPVYDVNHEHLKRYFSF